jgi:alpha-L-fucosidase 2
MYSVKIDRFTFLFVFSLAVTSCSESTDESLHRQNEILWYSYPAQYWNSQGLHLGNGNIGATFFGGVTKETFSITEKSIWHGGPFRGDWEEVGVNPRAKSGLPGIRKAALEGKVALADSLVRRDFLGSNDRFGSFSSIGDLTLSREDSADYSNYKRVLDLSTAIGSVSFTSDGVDYSREYFCSYPDNVLAIKLTASKESSIATKIGLSVIQKEYSVNTSSGGLEISGKIDGNERPFLVSIALVADGGKVVPEAETISIIGANSLTLFVAIGTDYALKYPDYRGESPRPKNDRVLENARALGYDQLRERHIHDYQELYDRVSLNLNGDHDLELLPTNERWENLRKGNPDPGLKELAFNLGRYMLISSSRPGTLPANLQGGWNIFNSAVWAGNYQSNINIQEIYWPCGPANLLECHEPWINWIRDLVPAGREVAKRVYGTEGWVSHSTGNIWGHAAPIGGLSWGLYPVGAAWHCQHLWDQYTFSQDEDYLRTVAFPIMKEASLFWIRNLQPFNEYLISTPTVSAEHGAMETAEGLNPASHELGASNYRYNIPGVYQDVEMIWDLFTNTAEAAAILDEKQYGDSLLVWREKLLPLKVGKHGQLQEWYEDIDSPVGHHRHIAHLYAVCPGRQIHPTTTPELAAAARKSLDMRGDTRFLEQEHPSGGNWSRAHRIACWVRLMDGNRANKMFTELLTDEGFENLLTFQHASWSNGRPDLFKENDSTFLYFQLDASASVPFFLSEMLLQSHMDEIHLLPSLPDEWPTGSVSGLLARGGHEISLRWENGVLLEAVIASRPGSEKLPVRVGSDLADAADPRIKFVTR